MRASGHTKPPRVAIFFGMTNAIWGGVLIGLTIATVLAELLQMWQEPAFADTLTQRPVWYYFASFGNLIIAACLLSVGIALLRARPWARNGALAIGVLAATWGICSLLINSMFGMHQLVDDGILVALLRLFAAQGGGAVSWVLYGVTLFVAMTVMGSIKRGLKHLAIEIAVVSILLMSAVCILTALREMTISARKPLTPDDLDRLAEILAASERPAIHLNAETGHDSDSALSDGLQARPPRDVHQSALTEHEADLDTEKDAPVQLPTRLERAASLEDLTARWVERRRSPRPTTTIRVLTSKAVGSMLWAAGADEEVLSLTCKTGRDLMELGKWEEARREFREVLHEALDTPTYGDYYVRYAAHCLAWLETDPEKAVHWLELSCQGTEASWNLAYAVDLTEATSSDALANHYLERLRTEAPRVARRYEEERKKRIEAGNTPERHWINTVFILPDL